MGHLKWCWQVPILCWLDSKWRWLWFNWCKHDEPSLWGNRFLGSKSGQIPTPFWRRWGIHLLQISQIVTLRCFVGGLSRLCIWGLLQRRTNALAAPRFSFIWYMVVLHKGKHVLVYSTTTMGPNTRTFPGRSHLGH